MECLDEQKQLATVSEANRALAQFLDQGRTFAAGISRDPRNDESDVLATMTGVLESVKILLDAGLARSHNGQIVVQLSQYRANLLRLQAYLAGRQEAASRKLDALRLRQNQVEAAKNWCQISRCIR